MDFGHATESSLQHRLLKESGSKQLATENHAGIEVTGGQTLKRALMIMVSTQLIPLCSFTRGIVVSLSLEVLKNRLAIR